MYLLRKVNLKPLMKLFNNVFCPTVHKIFTSVALVLTCGVFVMSYCLLDINILPN